MTGRRQVWASFSLLATSIVFWSLASGLTTTSSPALGLGAAGLVATAMLIAVRTAARIDLPLVLRSHSPVDGATGQVPPSAIRWSAPDAPGRPRPRAPGRGA